MPRANRYFLPDHIWHITPLQVGATYALRERSEAYEGEFASDNDALASENTIPWEKTMTLPKHSVV